MVLAACTGGTVAEPDPTPTPDDAGGAGGTVQIGFGGSPADLNPGLGTLVEDFFAYRMVYDTLATVDFEGEFQPSLAEDWSVSEDGLTWTLTLRDDAVFHDGTPVTADDVVFSMELFRDTPDFPILPTYFGPFAEIAAVDDTTVTVTTEAPVAAFDYRLPLAFVLPRHIWEAEDPVTFANDDMIGSGPFTLAEVAPGEFARFESNPDYWAGTPAVDEVIFRTYENSDARVQALINGEIDAAYEFPATAISTLQNADDIEVVEGLDFGGRFADIIFNVVDPENCPEEGGVCTGHPALRDVAVRRALAHATDKQQIIDVALLGTGEVGLGLVPPSLGDWFASELVDSDYAFDLDGARQLLEEAGYTDADGDGVRECPSEDCGPTGDLTFRVNYPTDNDEHPVVSDLLTGWWEEIGVQAEVQPLDPDTLASVCCPTFDYDVLLWTWGSDTDPEGLLQILLCDAVPAGFSETGYCNPEYDDLYFQQEAATDPEERRELIVELQRIALEDVPYIIPFYYPKVQAFRTDTFQGWQTGHPIIAVEDPANLRALAPVG